MDYIALNHNSERAKGVIYNSQKAIGGIYYKDDRVRPVRIEQDPTSGRKQAFVEIERKFAQKEKEFAKENQEEIKKIGEKYLEKIDDTERRQELIAEKVDELKEERTRFEKRLEKQKQRAMNRLQRNLKRDHEREIKEIAHARQEELKRLAQIEEDAMEKAMKNYVVTIQNSEIDFGREGIKKAYLSETDRDWLAKAQNHFITAKKNGRRIGSAEEYTPMDALEALWSTAVHVGIDPRRFIVQIYNETRFNPSAKGAAGERGVGQFKRTTAELYGYDWAVMKSGMKGYAYQAKAAAEFVQKVGEISYNGGGRQARRYQDRINKRIRDIGRSSPTCVLKNAELCMSKS